MENNKRLHQAWGIQGDASEKDKPCKLGSSSDEMKHVFTERCLHSDLRGLDIHPNSQQARPMRASAPFPPSPNSNHFHSTYSTSSVYLFLVDVMGVKWGYYLNTRYLGYSAANWGEYE